MEISPHRHLSVTERPGGVNTAKTKQETVHDCLAAVFSTTKDPISSWTVLDLGHVIVLPLMFSFD